MQTVKTSNQTITSNQSVVVIKTLLQAGLGCITYLRGLLPTDNFSNSHLISSKDTSLSFQPSENGDFGGPSSKRDRSNGLKVMTITRGFTEEADKLLNFLEFGIFDALEKQYLRKFIFAVYLDDKDPNNIVEAYTFHFSYHTVPGCEAPIAVMSLGEDMDKMNLQDSQRTEDPATEAVKKGNAPTFGEVKKSLRVLVKRLISATTSMENLPYHRYASFKLFYNDHTPEDYEPPHFRPGHFEKDRWTFATHNDKEAPEKISLGKLETPYHGVEIAIASVASYLPPVLAKDLNAHTRHSGDAPSLTPVQEASLRRQEIETLREDAEERRVVWPAEADDPDAEGEIDPDYAISSQRLDDSGVGLDAPIGIRNASGEIVPLSKDGTIDTAGAGEEEARFEGVSETVPSRVGQLTTNRFVGQLEQTQQLADTQEVEAPSNDEAVPPYDAPRFNAASTMSSLPPSDVGQVSQITTDSQEIETQALKDMMMDTTNTVTDTEMLDMETQVTTAVPTDDADPIESFGNGDNMDEDVPTPKSKPKPSDHVHADEVVDNGLDCACGVSIEDACCFCDAGCGRWHHIWCLGYHSVKDKRIPSKITCFDCRVRSDENWDLIVHDLYPQFMSRFNLLALFRRAIKVAETEEPETASAFAKLMGCEIGLASQLFDRLENEGFIEVEAMVTDENNLLSTRMQTAKKSHKAKSKQKQPRKKIQKVKFVFVSSSKKSAAYMDYFNPTPEVESRLMCLSGLIQKAKPVKKRRADDTETARPTPTDQRLQAVSEQLNRSPSVLATSSPQADSQTQDETQYWHLASSTTTLKRKSSTNGVDARKKIKISLAPAVDLGE